MHAAADGREGLKLLQSLAAPVDIIISDLDMPEWTAWSSCATWARCASRLVHRRERGRPQLLDSMETMAKAYGINFLGAIEKPVTRRKLETMLENRKPAGGARAQAAGRRRCPFTLDEIVCGLEGGEIEPFFQPKVEIATGRAVGMEALARWRHPRHGIVSPYDFIKPLEDAGQIDDLMRACSARRAEFVRELNARGRECFVAVNVSIHSLNDVGARRRDHQHRAASRRHAEIDRSRGHGVRGRDRHRPGAREPHAARMKGFELSIDDYGTGYSSLEQLMRIPFTELKIDQSFVMNAQRNHSAKVILASTLDLARSLKLRVVAEGVETKESWDLLAELKCDIAQGYYVSKPLSADAYVEWIVAWNRSHAATGVAAH